ncbi:hypothetical protein [Undibacterium umbellatum]|uniref:Uncharacterized protein n=1 Tax=Undibacterium umbellatum TaxID=2762300 RepID=A0ABR6ZD42_9BURK|nr:hypothetical protein [Undibacterium umbellatum]MBC3909638.1 hypothetical protein [Undibacterium umbellatum]
MHIKLTDDSVDGYNATIGRVVMLDGVALLALVIAILVKYSQRCNTPSVMA